MQALGEAGVTRPLALARTGGVGPAEDSQEVRGGIEAVVRELHRPRPRRQPGKTTLGPDQLVHRVVQHLSRHALGVVAREVLPVDRVVLVWQGAELVRARAAHRPHQVLQVVPALDELRGQRVEQLGVGRRVGLAHVVFGVDDAAAEEVLPVAVDQRAGEERVVLARQPVRQRQPRVLVGGHVQRGSPQPHRPDRLPRLGVGRAGAAAAVKHDLFARLRARLAPHARKERGEAVVVLLAPLLEGVVVALGALEPQPQEKLRRILELVVRRLDLPVPGNGRVGLHLARRGDDLAHELVVGLVGQQTVADPVVEGEGGAGVGRLAPLVAQDRAPLVGEEVGVVGAVQQPVDQLVSLCRVGIGKELARLVGGRQSAGHVHRHPPHERRVVAHLRGRHPHFFKLVEHELVDEVPRRRQLRRVDRCPQRNHRPEYRHLRLISHHYSHVARRLEHFYQPALLGRGHVLVVGLVHRAAGDVLGRTVGVPREDDELLLAARLHRPLARPDLDRGDGRVGGLAVGHALADPAGDEAVVVVGGVEPLAAAVGHRPDCLEQEQAVFRGGGEQAPAARFLHQVLIIFGRFKAEERELEPVLAARLPVAPAAVAAGLGEDRDDLVGEVDGPGRCELFDSYRQTGRWRAGGFRRNRRRSVAEGREEPRLIHLYDVDRRRLIGDVARQVAQRAVRRGCGHQQLPPRVRPDEAQRLRRRATGVGGGRAGMEPKTRFTGESGGGRETGQENGEESSSHDSVVKIPRRYPTNSRIG